MEFQIFTGKTVDDAITNASVALETTSDNLEIEVLEKVVMDFWEWVASLQKYRQS